MGKKNTSSGFILKWVFCLLCLINALEPKWHLFLPVGVAGGADVLWIPGHVCCVVAPCDASWPRVPARRCLGDQLLILFIPHQLFCLQPDLLVMGTVRFSSVLTHLGFNQSPAASIRAKPISVQKGRNFWTLLLLLITFIGILSSFLSLLTKKIGEAEN